MNSALYEPTFEMLDEQAPDSFLIGVETSEGYFEIKMHRAWSPLGVDRAWHLMRNDFYAGARIYRMVPGFVAQFGFSGDPVLDSTWRRRVLEDEPVVGTNTRGVVSFARSGARTRSFTLFVNLDDNSRLDAAEVGGVVGYPPIGVIEENVDVVDGFYSAYDIPGSIQDSLRILGNDYVRTAWPQLDSIVGTRIVTVWE
jgi:cyclophilin family peptidyl-prolyl cis-trans isomerase